MPFRAHGGLKLSVSWSNLLEIGRDQSRRIVISQNRIWFRESVTMYGTRMSPRNIPDIPDGVSDVEPVLWDMKRGYVFKFPDDAIKVQSFAWFAYKESFVCCFHECLKCSAAHHNAGFPALTFHVAQGLLHRGFDLLWYFRSPTKCARN